jgi:hypothetical protein
MPVKVDIQHPDEVSNACQHEATGSFFPSFIVVHEVNPTCQSGRGLSVAFFGGDGI